MERNGSCLRAVMLGIIIFLSTHNFSLAQDALDAITFTWVDKNSSANDYTTTSSSGAGQTIDPNTSYDLFFSRSTTTNNNRRVSGYTINGTTYTFLLDPDTLALRRLGTASRLSLWIEAEQAVNNTSDEIYLAPERQVPERALYRSNLLNIGYDNVLVNAGTNSSNIERIDAIYSSGMLTATPANAIIPVMDRGHNGEFKIAMITSLDANGEPASYGNLVEVTQGDFGSGVVTFSLSILFLQQSLGDDPIPTGSSTQNLGGVGISFSDMGISANQIVYGYSLFSVDVNTIDHDLTDISTFPTNSSNSGLDLAAGAVSAVSSDGNLIAATGPGGYKSSLSTWLKADAGVTTATDNSPASDWQDQALGDHDATALGREPTYRDGTASGLEDINFNPTLDFLAGVERGLTIADNSDFNTGGGPYTNKSLNIVFRTGPSDVNTRQQIFEQGGSDRGIGIYIEVGTLYVTAWNQPDDDGAGNASPWNSSSSINVLSTSVKANREYILTLEFLGDSNGGGKLIAYLNGSGLSSIPGIGQLFDDGDDIGLGDVAGTSRYQKSTISASSFYGSIPEFIYCNEPASFPIAQRNRIESYLALKYGITLDQSSPYNYVNADGDIIFNTTNNASIGGYLEYNSDIAGIGRDDDSEFEQLASQSENSGSIVRITRNSSIGTNDTWLIWGNDAQSATKANTSDKPAIISGRLERIWRVAEEGSIGVTDVAFDLTDLGFGTNASDFSLLIAGSSSGGSFSSASITTGGTTSIIDGRTFLTFSNIDLSDGEYFSLGTGFISCGPGGVTSNLAFWVKADLGPSSVIDNTSVAKWSGQINNNDASGSNLGGGNPEIPTYQTGEINYNPVIRFTDPGNTNAAFFSLARPAEDDFSVITVYSSSQNDSGTDSDDSPAIIGSSAGTGTDDDWALGLSDSRLHFKADEDNNGYGARSNGVTDYTNGIPRMLTGNRVVGSGDPDAFLYVDSEFIVNDGSTNTTLNSASTTGIGNHGIGNANTGSQFAGDVAEVIIYSDDISSTDQNLIESYLAIKYGISRNATDEAGTLTVDERDYRSSDGTVIWDFSDQSESYNTDIAGIGRDDDACLEQKQSSGVSSTAIASIGLGSIAATNQANSNTFTNSGDFLVWGHDGTAAGTTQATDVPGTVTNRLSRVWHVQETNTVGNTEVSFDLTGLGLSTSASDFQLIISPSTTMASGTTISGGSFNGNTLSFNNVDFSDGDFFTLGTARTSCGPGNVTVNLALWLRANEGTNTTTNGSDVTSWQDQSGNSNSATEDNAGGGSPLEPTYQSDEINFNPAIRISNAQSSNNSWLETSSNSTSAAMSMIAVFKTTQTSGSASDFTASPGIISGEAANNNDYALGISEGRLHINAADNTAFNARSSATYSDNVARIATGTRLQSTASGSIQLYVNSENLASGVSTNTNLNSASTFALGNHSVYDANGQFEGDIAEVIVYNQVLSETDQAKVESYLAIKYGITRTVSALSEAAEDYLASDGGVIWNIDTQGATYHHDIAGIGRDDNSCFLQEKSKSINTDALVTMERSASLNTDDSYLIWGNDNAAIESTSVPEIPLGIESRLLREWRVQETGTIGSISLTYDLSSISGPTGIGTNNLNLIRLLTDSDGDFSTGATLTSPTSIDAINSTVTFTVDFTSGQYFTLGSTEDAALPIELISFNGETTESNVLLNWSTLSEQNNAYFTVERSSNGNTFQGIGSIQGAGNSEGLIRYEFVDNQPLTGTSYYRLRQTDFDGTSSISEVLRLFFEKKPENSFILYPNPLTQGATLSLGFQVDREQFIQLQFISPKGEVFQTLQFILLPESDRIQLDVSSIPKGVYFIRIKTESGKTSTLKVIIS